MHILITGASGFIGSILAQRCQSLGHTLSLIGCSHENTVKTISESFHDFDWSIAPDLVVHLASITDTLKDDKEEMFRVNTEWAIKFIREAVDRSIPVVYASSAAVYGNGERAFVETDASNPLTYYGESKAKLDELTAGLPHVVGLRFTNVYGGPREEHKGRCASMVWRLYKTMVSSPPQLFKYGEQRRDWVFVHDVVDAILLSYKSEGIFNVGSGQVYTFNEVVDEINRTLKTTWKTKYIDNPIGERYQWYNLANIKKARESFGYEPQCDLHAGINRIFQLKMLLSSNKSNENSNEDKSKITHQTTYESQY